MSYNTFNPIVANGLILYVDSYNHKSYNGTNIATQSTMTGSTYIGDSTYTASFAMNRVSDNVLYPQVLALDGNISGVIKNAILSNDGSMPVYLSGGATAEVYYADHTMHDVYANKTILYSRILGNYITMSYACQTDSSNFSIFNYVRLIVPSMNLESLFGEYGAHGANIGTTALSFSLTGGIGTMTATHSYASHSGYALNRLSDNTPQPIVLAATFSASTPEEFDIWKLYVLSGGGTLSVYLSGGATAETYYVNNVSSIGYDIQLYPNFTGGWVTMSGTCSMGIFGVGTGYSIKMDGLSRLGIWQLYNTAYFPTPWGNNISLTFSLSGGVTPSTYGINYVQNDVTDTYIHEFYGTGDPYGDHTQYEVSVPEMLGTLYTDHTTMTFSHFYGPETVSYDSVQYDGLNTNFYISYAPITGKYSGHTEFQIVLPHEIPGLLYTDHTTATFSYQYGATAIDDIIRGGSGEVYNGAFFDGKNLTFDGVNDYIELLNNTPDGFTNYTLSVWVKNNRDSGIGNKFSNAQGDGSGSGGIVNYYDPIGDTGFGIELFSGGLNICFTRVPQFLGEWARAYAPIADPSYFNPIAIDLFKWVNITVVYDGSGSLDTDKLKLYIDGVEYTTLQFPGVYSIPTSIACPGTTLKIGQEPYNSAYFQGNISNVMAYNRSLSPSEVLQNYKALKNKFI